MTENRLRLVSEQGYTFEDAVREYNLSPRQSIGYVFQFQRDYRKDAQGGDVSENPSIKITRHMYALMEEAASGMVSQPGYVPLVSYVEFARPESFRRKINYFKEHMPVSYGIVIFGQNFGSPLIDGARNFDSLGNLAHNLEVDISRGTRGPDYRLPEFVRDHLAEVSFFRPQHFEKFSKAQRDELESRLNQIDE